MIKQSFDRFGLNITIGGKKFIQRLFSGDTRKYDFVV